MRGIPATVAGLVRSRQRLGYVNGLSGWTHIPVIGSLTFWFERVGFWLCRRSSRVTGPDALVEVWEQD